RIPEAHRHARVEVLRLGQELQPQHAVVEFLALEVDQAEVVSRLHAELAALVAHLPPADGLPVLQALLGAVEKGNGALFLCAGLGLLLAFLCLGAFFTLRFGFLPAFLCLGVLFTLRFGFLPAFLCLVLLFTLRFGFLPAFLCLGVLFTLRFGFLPAFLCLGVLFTLRFGFLPAFLCLGVLFTLRFGFLPAFLGPALLLPFGHLALDLLSPLLQRVAQARELAQ